MDQYHEKYETYVTICYKLNFFNSCKSSKIIPKGLVVEKNLATHVNDELFVKDFQETLDEASSRSLDRIIEKYEYSKLQMEEELEAIEIDRAEEVEIKRGVREIKAAYKVKLLNKHLEQVRHVQEAENTPFQRSMGSRKVKGLKYIPQKNCACNPKRLRPHELTRRRRTKKKKVVYFGPKQETLQDIIEVEQKKRDPINLTDFVITEDMKSVLRLGATFAPSPTRPVDVYSLYVDFHKWAERLRWHYLMNHKDPDQEDTFVKKPWYRPTDKRAPRANDATEAYIFKCQEELFDP